MNHSRHHIITEFIDYLKNVRAYSIHTLRSYAHDLDDFIKFCKINDDKQEFIQLKQSVIQAYLQEQSHKLQAVYQKIYH